MYNKAGKARDAFTFSLGGMATIASVVAPPVIADDRINRILDARAEEGGNADPLEHAHSHTRSVAQLQQVCCA